MFKIMYPSRLAFPGIEIPMIEDPSVVSPAAFV